MPERREEVAGHHLERVGERVLGLRALDDDRSRAITVPRMDGDVKSLISCCPARTSVAERRGEAALVAVREVREPHLEERAPVLVGLRVEEQVHVAEHERAGVRREEREQRASVGRVELVKAKVHEAVDREFARRERRRIGAQLAVVGSGRRGGARQRHDARHGKQRGE